jgi:hypothetical protein
VIDLRRSTPIQITSVSASGQGCPQGSYSTTISLDGTSVTLGFGIYQTHVGVGVPGVDREKFCYVTISLQYPIGCTSAILQSTYHGFAQLDSGVTGTFSSTYNTSPGQIGPNQPSSMFTSAVWSSGGVYTRSDASITTLRVISSTQREVGFISRSRIFLQMGQTNSFGTLTVDDLTVGISQQRSY